VKINSFDVIDKNEYWKRKCVKWVLGEFGYGVSICRNKGTQSDFGSPPFLPAAPHPGVLPPVLCVRGNAHKKRPENVSGKFGEIRAKFFRTPQNLSAPTPMNSLKQILSFCRFSTCSWSSTSLWRQRAIITGTSLTGSRDWQHCVNISLRNVLRCTSFCN